MKYVSTRDTSQKTLTFSEVILNGLAPDGGLYVPVNYPEFSKKTLQKLANASYQKLAFECMQAYVGSDLTSTELNSLINQTYQENIFANNKSITPITSLDKNLYLQDLSTGPSLAFKDIALQFLGRTMDYLLEKNDQKLTILGASSGDTVSAAEQALKSKSRINVVMLTPITGMSEFQKAQAGTILDKNIFNVSINGPFDTCQDLVKAINRDAEFKKTYCIGAVNSINWGRILAQLVYYFKGYLNVIKDIGDPCDVVVPSGNFGNVLAAYIAKRMGLPLRRLIVATNENTVLDRFFKQGLYQKTTVKVTSSPSMDISKASNLERFFFDLADRKASTLSEWMHTFEGKHSIDLGETLRDKAKDYGFYSGSSTHDQRALEIKRIYDTSNRVIDPHTAAAVKVAKDYQIDTVPMICMETAKPCKFENTIKQSLGFIPARPKGYENIENAKQRFYQVDDNTQALKDFIRQHIQIN